MNVQKILSRITPISVEREFAFYHRSDCTPIRKAERGHLMAAFSEKLSGLSVKTEVVEEVAANSIEVKVCFSTLERLRDDIIRVYRVIAAVIRDSPFYIIGTSQPRSSDAVSDEITHFFTTDVFNAEASFFAATNSLHLHIGAGNEESAVAIYNAGNRIASILLAMSQCTTIDGVERGRAHFVSNILGHFPRELVVPWQISTLKDFSLEVENARAAVERFIRTSVSADRLLILVSRYPEFISPDGRLLKLTPDKVFHATRLRPDKSVPELGLIGSVEFRPLDGQATMQMDIAHIEFSLGLIAHMIARDRAHTISPSEAAMLNREMRAIPANGFGAIQWDGLISPHGAYLDAYDGLETIGLDPEGILDIPLDGGKAEIACLRDSSADSIIRRNHNRFMKSVAD